MRRTSRLLILVAVVGVLAPTAASQTAVSAVDQDLVVSATSGAAGAEITVSSASCNTAVTDTTIQYLSVRLLSGTAPNEVLAGSAIGIEDQEAILIVPDWIDPAEPAVIEASCLKLTIEDEEDPNPPTETLLAYDPVAFDVEDSPDAPVQERTYNRTSLAAGQAFSVAATGCFLDDAYYGYVDVVAGSDLTFRTPSELAFSSEGEIDGGSFDVITAISNAQLNFTLTGAGGSIPEIGIEEIPTNVPAGTYSSLAYCMRESDGALLLFEPELIEVTSSTPPGVMDLTVPADSRTATLAGGSCAAGDVNALLWGEDIEASYGESFATARPAGPAPALRPAAALRSGTSRRVPSAASALLGDRATGRALVDEPIERFITPAADGSWSFSEDAGFDHGVVGGYAMCGDPLGDGFLYDDQAAVVDVAEPVTTTTTTTTTTTVPTPAPANAVSGTPDYAG